MYESESERYEKGVGLSVGLALRQCSENRKETLPGYFFFFFLTLPDDKITSVEIQVFISFGAYAVAPVRKKSGAFRSSSH